MTDWREAGLRADAHRIQRLWVAPFDNPAKDVVRRRVASVLVAAGGTIALDLGGGGSSAKVLKAAGLSVISVEDGSMKLEDRGNAVRAPRKRRAHETICAELGVDGRWGHAHQYAAEADVAFLDFCGPWSEATRLAIEASRHMKAIAVTLTTGHDIYSSATTQRERQLAYMTWLKDAWRPAIQKKPMPGQGRAFRNANCRILAEYRTDAGHPVWVFLLSTRRLPIPHLSAMERSALHPERKEEYNRRGIERKRHLWREDLEWRAKRQAYLREWKAARRADPVLREFDNQRQRESKQRRRDRQREQDDMAA